MMTSTLISEDSGGLISVLVGIFPPLFGIDIHEDWHSRPNHENEEEKREADVASQVRDQANCERTNERAGLLYCQP